jgi:hypothetical protein
LWKKAQRNRHRRSGNIEQAEACSRRQPGIECHYIKKHRTQRCARPADLARVSILPESRNAHPFTNIHCLFGVQTARHAAPLTAIIIAAAVLLCQGFIVVLVVDGAPKAQDALLHLPHINQRGQALTGSSSSTKGQAGRQAGSEVLQPPAPHMVAQVSGAGC